MQEPWYSEAYDSNWKLLNPYPVGIVVLPPTKYDPTKPTLCKLWLHGMDALGEGRKENLDNLWKGFQYTPGGPRLNPVVTQDWLDSAEKYNILCVLANSKEFFSPVRVKWVYDTVRKNFNTVDRWKIEGFSWGGGAIWEYIQQYPETVALACPVAGTDESTSGGNNFAKLVAAKTAVWAFVLDDSGATDESKTINQVNAINVLNPSVKAVYTQFNRTGHGGSADMQALTPPKAPGGKGFIDAAETPDELYVDINRNGPRGPKAGTVVPPVQPTPPTTGTLTADFNLTEGQAINASTFDLDASGSTGATSFFWVVNPVSADYAVFQKAKTGVANGFAAKTQLRNLQNGEYSIQLTVGNAKGEKSTKQVKIKVNLGDTQPAPRTLNEIDLSGKQAIFSDGSKEVVKQVITDKGTYDL